MPVDNQGEWQLEQHRADICTQHNLDIRAAEAKYIEDRAEQRRLYRRLQIENCEAKTEDKLRKVEQSRVYRAQQQEQDARFAEATLRAKNDKIVDEKRRQQIRESSDELKQLETKLRAAYALKELDLQLAEKRLIESNMKKNEELERKMQKELWEKQKKENEQQEQQLALRKQQYGTELREQLIGGDNKKRMLYEDFLKDKQIIDAAVRRIHEEDEKAELERMEKVQKTKREIDDFKTAQAIWRQKRRQELEEENRSIEAYLQKQKMDEQERKFKTKEQEERKNRMNAIVAARIFAIEEKKRETEDLMDTVAEEERIAALERRYQDDLQKKVRDREMMREVYQRQFEEKKERLQREAQEEKKLRQEMIDKLAEDARIDQMGSAKQRMKMVELRREVETILEEKRIQRTEEMQQLQKVEEMAKAEEKKRSDLIEEERLRMLKEHAKNLFEYIPHGVLRESDLPILGPEFVEKYGLKGNALKEKTNV